MENFCYHECHAEQNENVGEKCTRGGVEDEPTEKPMIAPKPTIAPVKHSLLRHKAAVKKEPMSDVEAVGSQAEDVAKETGDRLGLASKYETMAKSVQASAQAFQGFLESADAQAQGKAEMATAAARVTRKLVDEVQVAASMGAHQVFKSTLAEIAKEAHATAKIEWTKKADELEKSMKAAAPAAGKKAMIPYNDAMAKAGAAAAGWAKQGDGAGGLSFQLNLQAGMLMQQANQWNALGDFARAQGMVRQSMDLTAQAQGLAGAAQNAYDQSAKITSTLLDWGPISLNAAYHDEYMLNPDIPPPAGGII